MGDSVSSMKKGHRIFRIDKLPMDIGRFFLTALIPFYRIKKVYLGKKEDVKALKDGALLAANHSGFSDPMILETAFWYRRVHYVAGEIAMEGKLRGALMKAAGCIRLDRNTADLKAIRSCTKILKEGFLLTMFPQGGIAEEAAGFKSGIMLIATQADVPVLPLYIIKRKKWWQRIRIVIGQPLYWRDHCTKKMPAMKDLEQLTKQLEEEYEACRKKGLSIS